MARRIVFLGIGVVLTALCIGALTCWFFLSSWVPTHGKTLLIRALEQRGRWKVSVDTVRYEPFRGLLLTNLRVVDPGSDELWLAAPAMGIRLNWFDALIRRRLTFAGHAPLEVPCQTALRFSGRYDLRAQSLALEMETTDASLRTLAPPLIRRLPTSLKEGTVRLALSVTTQPGSPPMVAGRVIGAQLLWITPTFRFTGDATISGTARAPARAGAGWDLDAGIALRRGTLEGLPPLPAITDVNGAARLTREQLTIEQMTATALGSTWRLEGTVTTSAPSSFELLLTSQADLALLSSLQQEWHASGIADIQAVCRGPLQPHLTPDCLVRADLQDAGLTGPRLRHPLTHLAGRLEYDHLARRLTAAPLQATVLGATLVARGDYRLANPPQLSLALSGMLPLDFLKEWLPSQLAVQEVGGLAGLDLRVEGSLEDLRWTGQVELREASAQRATFPKKVARVTALVLLGEQQIDVREATLHLDGQPLTLAGTLALAEPHTLTATVGFSQGTLSLQGRLEPEEVLIDQADLQLQRSRLGVRGRLARTATQPSELVASGTLDVAELSALPLPLASFASQWSLHGMSTVDAQFDGPLATWPDAVIEGRVQAERLTVRDMPLERLICTLEQRDRILRVRLPVALVAEGKLTGEFTLEHGRQTPTFLLQTDLTGLQLATLAQAIPSWRTRELSGSASGHLLLSGAWGDRPSWRGEGWINASGERLGDLPLLAALFRGMFGGLADRLGLETLRRARITQASLRWTLARERFRTDDLRLGAVAGTEPIAVYATGSVGFDQTVDFVIQPELSEGVVLEAPTTSALARAVLKTAGQLDRLRRLIGRHRLTGTLAHPDYRFEFGTQETLQQIAPAPVDLLRDLLKTIR